MCVSLPPLLGSFCLNVFLLANFFVDSLVQKGDLVKGKGLYLHVIIL